jgi:phytoene desaturase
VKCIDIEGGRATGVTLENGERQKADLVIANADLPYVYNELLPQDGSAQKLAKKKYTSSALMFYWGIRGPKSTALLHHNVFLADDHYKTSFDNIFKDLTLPEVPSFYINVPSRSEADFAPIDGDGLMALVPVGHINQDKPQDWQSLENRAREYVLNRLQGIGLGDLTQRMVFEETIGPETYRQRWNLAKGSAFGLSHNFMQVGYLRPHNRHPRYPNLYFVGASTHPGTGLPIVLLSARLTAERIVKEGPKPEKTSIPVREPALEKT